MASVYGFVFEKNGLEYSYIGSSFDLKSRKNSHRSDCYNINSKKYNRKVYKTIKETCINWNQIEWFVLEEYPELIDSKKGSDDTKELTKYETIWMNRIKPNLNKNIPSVTKEQTNEKRNLYKKEKILCKVCNCYTNRGNILRHNNTNNHLINNMVYN